jgi:hypothetical protein
MATNQALILAASLAVILPSPAAAEDLAVDDSSASEAALEVDASSTTAEKDTAKTEDREWEVILTPYIWIAGTNGNIGIPRGDSEIEIDKSFADTLGNLKFAFMGTLDVRHDRLVAMTDVIFLSVGAKADSVRNPQFFEGKFDASVLVTTAAVGYRVLDRDRLFVDLLVGARYTGLDVKLELEGPLQTREAKASPSSIAPLFGARAQLPISHNLALVLYGDAGGFGGADVKWQAAGTMQWDISQHWRLIGGYRHMAIHHDKSRFEFDVALSGPVLGASYKF